MSEELIHRIEVSLHDVINDGEINPTIDEWENVLSAKGIGPNMSFSEAKKYVVRVEVIKIADENQHDRVDQANG